MFYVTLWSTQLQPTNFAISPEKNNTHPAKDRTFPFLITSDRSPPNAKVKEESGQNRAKAGKRVARKRLIYKILQNFYSKNGK